ncbi:MAG: hypothetical protein U0822_18550 [Anaerolineae bacterium]
MVRSSWPIWLALFAAVLAAYFVVYSRRVDMPADEGHMLAVTESLVKFGRFSVDHADNFQYIPEIALGRDGARYTKYGIGQSLAAAPLYALALVVPWLGLIDTVLLLNPLVTALTAVVLFVTCQTVYATRREALGVALVFAFCTPAFVYAKNFYSEPLSGLGLALASLGVAVMLTRRTASGALLAGIGIGLGMLVKSSAVIVAPILLFVVWRWGAPRRWRMALVAGAPVVVAAALIALYNTARFGNPLTTGYGSETFTTFPLVGALGLLFAPGRSLFLYAPMALVALYGAARLRRPPGFRAWVIGSFAAILLLHGAWDAWWGAWAYGPRLLVSTMPLLALGMLPVFEMAKKWGWGKRALLAAVLVASFLIQLPGVLVYRVSFFWKVMDATGPGINPDEVSLYSFQYFMPWSNVTDALAGKLDLAWKAGETASVDWLGFGIVALGAVIGAIGLLIAWRGGRTARVAAPVAALVVVATTFGGLAHFERADHNPFEGIIQAVTSVVPADSVVMLSGSDADTTQAFWNVNRGRLNLVGVPIDGYWVDRMMRPYLRQAVEQGKDVWALQLPDNSPGSLDEKMRAADLCESSRQAVPGAWLMHWEPCSGAGKSPNASD